MQVDLLFAFCQELGLTSVVLVGHADGGLLALMAAARALKSKDSIQVCYKLTFRLKTQKFWPWQVKKSLWFPQSDGCCLAEIFWRLVIVSQ